ncbi:MAG TPA: 2-isopropylmalate synthase [Verrucomicrobiae bacterium]|jgi:2-isopropylmalate synthase|nr:2-isopropylmalate synthase [Verrucomicrobiae bacterium]
METVRIFDTTLRDGEQSPGFSMSVPEKVRMARQLESLGADIIESGFPIASAGDLEGTRAVCREIRSCTVAALARTRRDDIDAALEGLSGAAHPRLHTFLATSDLHLQHKLRLTREEALEAISSNVKYARERCAEVEFSAEDASRTDINFLCEAVSRAVRAGATTINLPDTVGYAVPEEYAAMFRRVIEHLDGANGITLSAHCHDDLGLAVANSLAAVQAGARQLELTINGIGERAGNAALEEVVVLLNVRQATLGVKTNVRLEMLYATSRMLTEITGAQVAPNKAVVGANAFAHEAGIHQDGILKNPLTYEIISPEAVGVPKRQLVLGKHSGRNALRATLVDLGYQPSREELDECYKRVVELADASKQVTNRDVLAIAHQVMRKRGSETALAT